MKKCLFDTIAVVVAISLSAFTTPWHKFATTYFKYVGTNDAGYSVAANWLMSSTPFDPCDDVVKACTVESTTMSSAAQIAFYCSVHNPQVSNGTIYVIDSQRAAF